MRRAITAVAAALVLAVAGFINVAGGEGRGYVNGAFQAVATGGFNVSVGTAAGAAPIRIPAAERVLDVLIFGYRGGPSEGRTFCADAWNVIVTVAFGLRADKPFLRGVSARHYLDGQLVGAEETTPFKASEGFAEERGISRAFGTFLEPGTLSNGTHEVSQVLEHETFGVLWAPPPLELNVSDSAC